jgi:DNA-binding CsgD family transcriptional regulator
MIKAKVKRPAADPQGYWHYTYVTCDPETGQWYGGKHSTRKLNDGYRGSGDWIRDHPCPERLVTKIVAFHASEEAAYLAEAALITDDIANDERCMNRTGGGYGISSEAARRIAVSSAHAARVMTQLWANPAFRAKMMTILRPGGRPNWNDASYRAKGEAFLSRARIAKRSTRAEKEQIIQLASEGVANAEIARRFNLHQTSVWRILKQAKTA